MRPTFSTSCSRRSSSFSRRGSGLSSSSLAVFRSERVAAVMPQLEEELARLVAIPSVSATGFPEPRQPLLDAYDFVLED